jgi:hypothetical protein
LQVEQFWGSSFEWSTTAFMVEAENGGDGWGADLILPLLRFWFHPSFLQILFLFILLFNSARACLDWWLWSEWCRGWWMGLMVVMGLCMIGWGEAGLGKDRWWWLELELKSLDLWLMAGLHGLGGWARAAWWWFCGEMGARVHRFGKGLKGTAWC